MIDLSQLPAPEVVEPLDFEGIYQDLLATFRALMGDGWTAPLESDPVVKLLELCAYREVQLRARINDAARSVLLAYAVGADLEQLAANVNVSRLLVSSGDPEASPPVDPVYENDASLRARVQRAFEGLSVAGPRAAYVFHALSADGRVADPVALETLMGSDLADMAFTDPPYNVNYANTAKDKQRGTHRPILNDNLGEGFAGFLSAACANLLTYSKGAVYIAMSSSELDTLQLAFRGAGGKWSTFIIWAKNTFTLGRADYQRQYEPILYGWRDGVDHFWCGDRDQGDVWFINKPVKNDLHPTMKPVELVERAIRNSSKTRDIVLDLFGGSGTTLIAAEKTQRRARLVELDPKYADVIVKRWQDYTGKAATLAATGKTFAECATSDQLAPEPQEA